MKDIGHEFANDAGAPDRWLVLILLSLDYFVLYLHRNLINYLQPPLIADLDLTDTQLGFLRWGFVLPYALAQIGVGYLGDRYRRRSVLLVSLVTSTIVLAAMGLARSFTELLILRILLAVAQSASVPAIASVIADCFTPKNRSTAVSIYLISYNFSLVLAGWLGGTIADTPLWNLGNFGGKAIEVAGWRMSMFSFGAFGGLAALAIFFLLREPQRTERVARAGLGPRGASLFATLISVIKVRTYLAIAAAFVCIGLVLNQIRFWLARYFHDQLEMDLGEAGFFGTFWIQSGTVLGLVCGGLWADSWARRSWNGRTGVQLVGLLAWIPALIIIGTSNHRLLLMLMMFLFGLGAGLYQANLWTATFEVIDPAARSTAIGLLNVAFGVFGSWSSPFVGYLLEHKYVNHLGEVLTSLSLVAAAAVIILALNMRFLLPGDYRGPVKL